MSKLCLLALSATAAAIVGALPASAQMFQAPDDVEFGNVLVGSTAATNYTIDIVGAVTDMFITGASAPFTGSGQTLSNLSAGDEVAMSASFAPTQAGSQYDGVGIAAYRYAGELQSQTGTTILTGTAVAPIESISTSAAPVVRIGTSTEQTVTISNTGDGNQAGAGQVGNLNGSIGASSGVFKGAGGSFSLLDSSHTSFNYNFKPNAHGAVTGSVTAAFTNGSADGTNSASTLSVALSGQGVGPQYTSSVLPGGVIDLGTIKLGGTGMAELDIGNVSTDDASGALTDLTLRAADIGPPASNFSLGNFVVGTVLGEGDSFGLDIDFSAASLGQQTTDLLINTDQGAAFGDHGQTFEYQLTADVVAAGVPEPSSWIMLAVGFAGVGLVGCRKTRARLTKAPVPNLS